MVSFNPLDFVVSLIALKLGLNKIVVALIIAFLV